MAAMSNYLENKLIDHIFRATSFTAPTNIYIALCTASPTDASTGSTITEVSGGSYARQAYNPSNNSNWEATQGGVSGASSGTGGTTSNNTTIAFPTATADWGTITSVALVDASSAGNVLFYGDLTSSRTINNGDTFQFNANALALQLDN
jgi:hypothetical protein